MKRFKQSEAIGSLAVLLAMASGCDNQVKFSRASVEYKKAPPSGQDHEKGGAGSDDGEQIPDPNQPPKDPPIPDKPPVLPPIPMTLLTSFPLTKETINLPMKLSIIVDDSSSMLSKQVSLAAGLETAFAQLKGKDVEIFLYSTSLLRNKLYINTFTYDDPLSDLVYSYGGLNTGPYSSATLRPSLQWTTETLTGTTWSPLLKTKIDFIPDEVRTRYFLGKSLFSTPSGSLKFTPSMDNVSFDKQLATLKKEVLIGESGDPDEMPLCSLAAMLSNDGPNKIFSSGDRAAFLLITDEDQVTSKACLKSTTTVLDKTQRYTARALVNRTIVYQPLQKQCDDDGVSGAWCVAGGSTQSYHLDCKTNPMCDPYNHGYADQKPYDCTPEQLVKYKEYIEKVYQKQFAAGTMRYTPGGVCKTANDVTTMPNWVEVDSAFNKSTPVTVKGVTYPNLIAYTQSLNPNAFLTGEIQKTSGFVPPTKVVDEPFLGVPSSKDLPAYLRNQAKTLFGANNFIFSVIGNLGANNPPGCALSNDDASNLVLQIADVKSSVCESDYSQNLSWLKQFTSERLKSTYDITEPKVREALANGSAIVVLKSPSDSIALKAVDDYTYDPTTYTLTVLRSMDLSTTWTLEVLVADDAE